MVLLGLESLLLAPHADRILGLAAQEVSAFGELTIAFLSYNQLRIRFHVQVQRLTVQTKHSLCQSEPRAFTTTSVTGFLHLRHFEL